MDDSIWTGAWPVFFVQVTVFQSGACSPGTIVSGDIYSVVMYADGISI